MINNHHYSRYLRFIDSLKGQVVVGYSEKHHVVPRSHGGSNKKDNLVALTPRQHFIAHRMLWKAYGGSMARAFFMMSATGKYGKVGSKTYAMVREEYSKQVVMQMTGKPAQGKFDAEHRAKLSQAKLGKKNSPEHNEKVRQARLGKPLSEETKQRISQAKKGISTRGSGWTVSAEVRQNMALAQTGALNHRFGKTHSMETRKKMSQSHLKRKQLGVNYG